MVMNNHANKYYMLY